MIKRILIGLLALAPVAALAQWEEGTHYQELSSELDTRSGDQFEIAEVFWYGCPACQNMQPVLEEWKQSKSDDVALRHVPAALRADWRPHAQAYYVAVELDVLDEIHQPLFEALAGERRNLQSKEAIAEFFEEKGVAEADEVEDAWDSFSVDSAMRRGDQFVQGAQVSGTPSLVVEGRYLITARGAESYENMLAIADYLVDRERE